MSVTIKLPNVTPTAILYWNNESIYQPPATRSKTINIPSGSQLVQAILMWNCVNKDAAAGIKFLDIMFNSYAVGTSSDSYADVTAYLKQNASNTVEIDYSVPSWSQYALGINASFAANVSLALYIVQSQPSPTPTPTGSGSGGATSIGTVNTNGGGSNTGTQSSTGTQPYAGPASSNPLTTQFLGLPVYVWIIIAGFVVLAVALLLWQRRGFE